MLRFQTFLWTSELVRVQGWGVCKAFLCSLACGGQLTLGSFCLPPSYCGWHSLYSELIFQIKTCDILWFRCYFWYERGVTWEMWFDYWMKCGHLGPFSLVYLKSVSSENLGWVIQCGCVCFGGGVSVGRGREYTLQVVSKFIPFLGLSCLISEIALLICQRLR